jgi:cytochrome P450
MQPAFHRDRIAEYAQVMTECADEVCARWRDGEVLDAGRAMNRLALAIVSRTLFSTNTDAGAEKIRASLEEILTMLNRLVLPPGELRLMAPLPSTLRYKRALRDLDEVVFRLIAERRASGPRGGDLLDLLMAARDEEGGGGMDDAQLRDEVVTLFVAGHDTTANALAWTWHHLSREEKARAAVESCVDGVLKGRAPTFEDYPALTEVERAVAESMRLHPPVWILGRRPKRAFELGGVQMDGNSILLVCMAVLHRRPELWPEPERFDMARHAHGQERHKYAFLPFGAGSRLCIGERFAWMETVLCVAAIARRWRLERVEEEVVPKALLTLRPRDGLRMRAVRRTTS